MYKVSDVFMDMNFSVIYQLDFGCENFEKQHKWLELV